MIQDIKVLIVDDSIVFRKTVETILSDEPGISVTGSVRNGEKALEAIAKSDPDIITLDVEMPEMNGIETLRAVQELNKKNSKKIDVIMLSAFTSKGAEVTLQALDEGAFDFILKPEGPDQDQNRDKLKKMLLLKIGECALSRKHHYVPSTDSSARLKRPALLEKVKSSANSQIQAIAIGVSTGGPKALNQMLPLLSEATKLPILIVQHMPPTFTQSLATQLSAKCQAKVVEASDGETVKDGHIYIAPGGKHLCVKRNGASIQTIITDTPPENGCKPSVDVLFRSVAAVYGDAAIAVIMTGMGNDGAQATGALKRAGAYIIVQDEESSIVWGMPGSAVATGNVDEIKPLLEIPDAIVSVINKTNRRVR